MKLWAMCFTLLTFAAPLSAQAAAIVLRLAGSASVDIAGASSPLALGQQVDSGALVSTGQNGRLALRFDDGQIAMLDANSQLRIDDYRYDAQQPANGKVALSLVQGATRMITGDIGKANKAAFSLKTPVATIGIRGSDWMAALQNNSLYTGVNSGGIAVNNGANTLLVDAGQYSAGLAGQASHLVSFSQLPANVFGSLPNLSIGGANWAGDVGGGLSTGSTSSAAGAGVGGVASGVATGVAITTTLGALISAVADDDSAGSTATSGTTGTTGTQ